MNSQQVIDMVSSMIYLTAEVSLPLLIVAVVIGLVISIFQAATQINEATLSFLPKIAAILGVIILISPWIVRKMTSYTRNLYERIPEITRNR